MNRGDLQALSRVRLAEAKALLRAGFADGAFYLAGYSVECALKACIAKQTKRHDFPDKKKVLDSYTHDFGKLIERAGLRAEFAAREKADAEFQGNWRTMESWSEESRYRGQSSLQAQGLIRAIEDRKHGVMGWIKHYW